MGGPEVESFPTLIFKQILLPSAVLQMMGISIEALNKSYRPKPFKK